MGVGMPQRQFAAWVHYYLTHMTEEGEALPSATKSSSEFLDAIQHEISSEEVDWENGWEDHTPAIHRHWKEGRLICEHTSLLNGPRRANNADQNRNQSNAEGEGEGAGDAERTKEETKAKKEEEERQFRFRTEQFRDMLNSYADRMASIVEDELSDGHFAPSNDLGNGWPFDFGIGMQRPPPTPEWTTRGGLRGWIKEEYGAEKTSQLSAGALLKKSEEEQLKVRVFATSTFISKDGGDEGFARGIDFDRCRPR